MKKLIQFTALLFFLAAGLNFSQAQGLSGQYTIGPSGDYTSFGDALADIQELELADDAAFIITEGTYSETLTFELPESEFHLAFKADINNTDDVILQSADPYVVNIISAQNISFDGIHFKNIAESTPNQANVIIFEPGTTQKKNISFTGCTFTGYDVNNFEEETGKELIKSDFPETGDFMPDSLLFDNCQFVNGNRAVSFWGTDIERGSYVKIMNSDFSNFFSDGFYSEYFDWVSLSGNTFDWKQSGDIVEPIKISFGNTIEIIANEMIGDYTGEDGFTGITVDDSEQISVSKNKIDVNFTGEYGYAVGIRFGFDTLVDVSNNYIRLNSNDSNTGIRFLNVTDSIFVSNNMIIAYSESKFSSNIYGIDISMGENPATIDVINNSISIPKGFGYALYYDNMMMAGTINMHNNIFANNSEHPVVYLYSGVNGFSTDYNIYHTGSAVLIESSAEASYNLSEWQAFSNDDANSFQVNPRFIDPMADLHLRKVNPAEGRAMSIAEVTKDFDGQVRNTENPDIGADEGNFVLLDFTVDAGPNQSDCSDTYTMKAADPSPAKGEWSVEKGGAIIQNISNPSTVITNVQPGENILRWTVATNTHSAYDDVVIFNQQPVADAGEDVGVFLDDLSGDYPTVTLEAAFDNESGENIEGLWEIVSPSGTLGLSNEYASSLTVTGLEPGIHTLRWTVTDPGDIPCSNSDEVNIVAGHSFVSDPQDENEYNWDDPTFWNFGQAPGPNDSVTVFNSNLVINGSAVANEMIVGNGSSLKIEGTAKGDGSLTTNSLYIEQSAVKFKGIKGDANVTVGSGGGLYIEQSAVKTAKASSSKSGLHVGSGGGLYIEQSAVKADGDAEVRISGGGLYIEQSAVKADGDAEVRVGTGGGLYIEQSAVKSSKADADNPGIKIGNGGGLYIEQSAVKEGTPGQVTLSAGNGIYIEQSAVKADEKKGLVVRGGGLYIEQSAVKSTGGSGKITVENNGGLYIEQSAVKSDAIVSAPYIEILDGEVVVGAESKSKTQGGKLSFRGLYIEQTAVKGTATDTALTINPGASLFLDESYTDILPKFEVSNGAAVSAKANSLLFEEGSTEDVQMRLHEGASFIDKSGSEALSGNYKYFFEAGLDKLFASPFETTETSQFDLSPEMLHWDEASSEWADAVGETFTAGEGMLVNYPDEDNEQTLAGVFNKGDQSISLVNSGTDLLSGWNLAGNPYTSAIDWDAVSLDPNINPAIYVYDSQAKVFKLYQQNGIQLNDGSRYIMAGDAFMAQTAADADLILTSDAQAHYMASPGATENTVSQLLKFKLEGNGVSDEAAVHFAEGASEGLDTQFDAEKIMNFDEEALNVFTKSTSTDYAHQFAINTLNESGAEYTIPLGFTVPESGTYEISLLTNTLANSAVSVELKDLVTGDVQDLKTDPVYSFEHTAGTKSERFNLIVGEGVSGFEVNFNVTDGNDALSGASVTIQETDETLTTDAAGTATTDLQDGTYNYEVSLDGYQTHTGTFTVEGSDENVDVVLDEATGIEQLSADVKIYPNPSKGNFMIESDKRVHVKVTDVFGKEIKEDYINGKGNIILQASGVYFLKISDGNAFEVRKVVVKK